MIHVENSPAPIVDVNKKLEECKKGKEEAAKNLQNYKSCISLDNSSGYEQCLSKT